MSDTKVDILVLGATGFTGALITKYLDNHSSRSSFSLGIGGRSSQKLQALVKDQSLSASISIFTFNTSKLDEVNNVVGKAKIVINCIGPFWKYSMPIVQACAANGVHYLDTAGEPWWIEDVIQQYDYQVMKKKIIMIPAAGVDSVPSDLAVYLSARALVKKIGSNVSIGSSITSINMANGMLSGGTFATMLSAFDLPPARMESMTTDLYSLTPIKGRLHPFHLTRPIPFSSVYGGISLMGAINERVVNRTWGLLEARSKSTSQAYPPNEEEDHTFHYGPNFCYEEYSEWNYSFTSSIFGVVFVAAIAALTWLPPLRRFLEFIGPKSGTGPQLKPGEQYTYTNVTSTDGPNSKHVKTVVTFQGNGYVSTACMTSESALAILLDRKQLPSMSRTGGILTPMTALGDVLIKRLLISGRVKYDTHILHPQETKKAA